MTDGDRPLNNDWVLGPEPLDMWELAFSPGRDRYLRERSVRSKVPTGNVRESSAGNVRRTPRPRCAFCGAPTKLIGRKLFCRDCGYFEGCCDGGKEALEGEC